MGEGCEGLEVRSEVEVGVLHEDVAERGEELWDAADVEKLGFEGLVGGLD